MTSDCYLAGWTSYGGTILRALDVSGTQTILFQQVGFLLCQNACIGVAAFLGAAGVKGGATDRANFR